MFYTCQVDCRNMVNYLLLSAILGNYLEGPLVQIKADKTKNIIKAATLEVMVDHRKHYGREPLGNQPV